MDEKTTGAWIVHHTNKLQQITNPSHFDSILLAGKAGILLSALSASDQETTIAAGIVETIAKASGISPRLELPTLLEKLKNALLIDVGATGDVQTLGLTTASVLSHTNNIFVGESPNVSEVAVLELSEMVSQSPQQHDSVAEYLADSYRLPDADVEDLLDQTEKIGFVDYEQVDDQRKIYFNGNLFRRENAKKADSVLSSLKQTDIDKVLEVQQLLEVSVCLSYQQVVSILGKNLFQKLQAIGMYDVNTISNETESVEYITRPSAFSKYGNALVEDALDLAKAFSTSLTYGMTRRSPSQGRITMLQALMSKLIRGAWVGPATAIGHDYKVLELKRVIETRDDGYGRFSMRLLKKDVGELALLAIQQGDISEASLQPLSSVSITNYHGPERNREIERRQHMSRSDRQVIDMLRTLRQE